MYIYVCIHKWQFIPSFRLPTRCLHQPLLVYVCMYVCMYVYIHTYLKHHPQLAHHASAMRRVKYQHFIDHLHRLLILVFACEYRPRIFGENVTVIWRTFERFGVDGVCLTGSIILCMCMCMCVCMLCVYAGIFGKDVAVV